MLIAIKDNLDWDFISLAVGMGLIMMACGLTFTVCAVVLNYFGVTP